MASRELAGFILQLLFADQRVLLIRCYARSRHFRAVSESIPSAAVLHWQVGIRDFIEKRIIVIGVSFDEAVFDPPDERCDVNAEAGPPRGRIVVARIGT